MKRKSAESTETTRKEMRTEVKTEEIKTNQLTGSKAACAKQVKKKFEEISKQSSRILHRKNGHLC